MKEGRDFTEQRQHERAGVQTIVVGILNSRKSVTIGSITDISLGGIKCTYNNELRTEPNDNLIHSVDLIAESHNLVDIPCKYAWDVKVETNSDDKLTDLRQCGVQFGKLTPNQIFLLRNFIDHYASLGIKGITSDVHITSN